MTDSADLAPSLSNGLCQDHHSTPDIKPEYAQEDNQTSWLENAQADAHKHGPVDPHEHGPVDPHEHGPVDPHQHPDAPAPKRRKLIEETNNDMLKSSPRPISPPWKSVGAKGPTSFLDNGKRRSGRTNTIPLELQPQSARRQTRAAYDKSNEKPLRPVYNGTQKPKLDPVKHGRTTSHDHPAPPQRTSSRPSSKAGPPPTVKKEPAKKTLTKSTLTRDRPSPTRKSTRIPTKSKRELVEEDGLAMTERTLSTDPSDDFPRSPSPPLMLKKVSFRVRLPRPTIMTPANIPLPRKYPTFDHFIDQDESEDPAPRPPMSQAQIEKEAAKRLMVQRAMKPGQLANPAVPLKQHEPPRHYVHHDHLLAHIDYFRTLLKKEKKEHRRNAELIAHEAKRYLEAKRAKGRVKTAEEIEREQMLLWLGRFKAVVKDVGKLWQAVEAEVNAARLRQFEQEQQEKIKGHLNRVLDRTDAMLKRHDTETSGTDVDDSELEDDSTDQSDDGISENSEQMSASDVSSESSAEVEEDVDANMTLEELKAKYENIPQIEADSTAPTSDVDMADSADEDSDPETIMDSEMETDDAEDEESEEEELDSDADQDGAGLLSLFSKQEIEEMVPEAHEASGDASPNADLDTETEVTRADSVLEPEAGTHAEAEQVATTINTSTEGLVQDMSEHMDIDVKPLGLSADTKNVETNPLTLILDGESSRDQSDRTSPGTSVTKATELESVSSIGHRHESHQPDAMEYSKSKHATPVPPLLRGTLREYQHEGLDWLANLYANGRSGILADEMGLGKTIQSIALLAHLATTYEVWGPHLIVVPTSVMLNWEMEFKKFLPGFKILTYYGDIKERKQKRRGWMSEDSFNVLITSYQLVLQDASSFKRRKWHYMILDEAHNIKNFRSERWQTMMTFNTRARLLLTGTPLQNNLTELWSLLFFLHYGQETEGEDDAFAGLREWSEWFKRPVESILEHGKQVLDQEDQQQVAKLHKVIRPFLLRRLKADVEKQMPLKYEHVEICRLSKRQRQLYDGFMSRAQTRETLASGNYLSIINALMQLRKVCNHPDLFETRPINTSFAMPKSVAADFEIKDLLVRRKLMNHDPFSHADLDFLELVPVSREFMSKHQLIEVSKWNAYQPLKDLRERQWLRVRNRSKIFATADRDEIMSSLESVARQARLQHIERSMYYDAYKHHQHPVYGTDLFRNLNFPMKHKELLNCSLHKTEERFWDRVSVFNSVNLVQSLEYRSRVMQPFIEQYACITPAAVAVDMPVTVIGESRTKPIRQHQAIQSYDPFHQAQMKLSIAFPDKRLLQYDCGKLQRLDKLLRELQTGGHRALIFTQMTKVLDILEQFLNIHGHRYLRLDGSTKVEQRQILTDRFNNDQRILCFILSSRSGGLGINLTGADTVIFYDLDWNPAMDKQCTDRAHRIGQTRDVHIYRFVSEHTIESNILRKASQKQLLDDVVIQEGDFTTDYLNKVTYRDMLDDGNVDEDDVAGAAMDRVLGGGIGEGKNKSSNAFEQVEDRDDVAAARVAAKEVQHADDGDFDENPQMPEAPESKLNSSDPFRATNTAIAEVDEDIDTIHHIDDYMLKMQHHLLKHVPLVIKSRDRSKRGRNRKKGGDLRRR